MYEVEVRQDIRIPTADAAVTLGADLYLPAGAGPVPLLLMALPYRKDRGGSDLLHRYFARRGYASMILDLQGTGSSDGDPRAPFAVEDAQDAVDAITWAAEQDWCDGAVGMWGHSYGGLMTMRAASLRPPALKAIIPVQGLIDPEVDFVHPDFARGSYGPLAWVSGMVANLLIPPLHDPDDETALARWRTRLDRADTHVLDIFRHAPGAQEWRRREVDVAAIDVPALCFLGWRDLFCDAQARAFEAMSGPKRLIAGPWMHVLPIVSAEGPLDFLGICLSWWDRWLKGIDNGADNEPSVAFVQGPASHWTALETWPPEEHVVAAVEQKAGIQLRLTCAAEAQDPTVGALSGLTRLPMAGIGMPLDQHEDDLRSTCWTSEPLTQPLTIIGRPRVTFGAAVAGRVVVKLTHVDVAGRSVLITSGALGEAAAPASQLELDATAYQVPVGQRIRIVLSDADFPRLWPVPSEGVPEAHLVTVSLPTLCETRDVDLPAQPAHLAALLAGLADGGGGTWSLQRELLGGTLTMSMDSRAPDAVTDGGLRVESSTSVVVTASRSQPASAAASSHWQLHWPSRPVIGVHTEVTQTDHSLVVRGRVTTGNDVTFEKTWSTDD